MSRYAVGAELKPRNGRLKEAIADKLKTRRIWLNRSELVQCLITQPEYRNRPAIPLANDISHALQAIKADGMATDANVGHVRYWHYLDDTTDVEQIMTELNKETGDPASDSGPVDAQLNDPAADPIYGEIQALRNKLDAPKLPPLAGKAEKLHTLALVREFFAAEVLGCRTAEVLAEIEAVLRQFPDDPSPKV